MMQTTLTRLCVAAAFILVLPGCNSHGLLEKLENPCGANCSPQSAADAIYLFAAATLPNGNIAGYGSGNPRTGADNLCTSSRSGFIFPNNTCSSVRGFISVTGSDSIAALPLNYSIHTGRAIHGPTGTLIANDWVDLMDGSIANSLSVAGVASVSWWSFSGSNGATANDCSDGTDSTTGTSGIIGIANATNTTWIQGGTDTCDQTRRVLCLCF